MTGLADCRTDPGELGTDDAIRAMSVHHDCAPQCHVLRRASDRLDAAYGCVPLTAKRGVSSASQISETDRLLAARIREYLALPRQFPAGPRSRYSR
ncbi:hypothetical protein OG225_36845 [Nocardia sp. NBC_01377]|uniref:hypothetical protein n=1 Tax=Nocardia sp. NBC_01377 TaxID=2903595 RepID=UPI00324D07A3